MPAKETKTKAVREADQEAILQFCGLPAAMTKRCLILKAFERMMLKQQPEQTFQFLDRNFVEEFHDKTTMRQVLSQTLTQMTPDMVTEYYEMLDGLLVAMYHKNPPGRLLRDQWTHKVSSLPDFTDWKDIIKEEGLEVDEAKLVDISNDKVGLLRSNTKMSFPSDNSILRVEKELVGQRRVGVSKILKDNLMFGVKEQPAKFAGKVQGEDPIRNMDARNKADRYCDFWLLFDNGVRLTVEYQQHQEPDMAEIPKSQMPRWLKQKLERERRALLAQDDASESGTGERRSQLQETAAIDVEQSQTMPEGDVNPLQKSHSSLQEPAAQESQEAGSRLS
jgi:hypothetical protein